MGSFSIFHWIIFALIAAFVAAAFRGFTGGGKTMFCATCGHEGETKTHTRGSLLIEVVLWLCFIIPGLIYSVWRISSRHQVCNSCGASTLVPPNSPVAINQKRQLAAGQ